MTEMTSRQFPAPREHCFGGTVQCLVTPWLVLGWGPRLVLCVCSSAPSEIQYKNIPELEWIHDIIWSILFHLRWGNQGPRKCCDFWSHMAGKTRGKTRTLVVCHKCTCCFQNATLTQLQEWPASLDFPGIHCFTKKAAISWSFPQLPLLLGFASNASLAPRSTGPISSVYYGFLHSFLFL